MLALITFYAVTPLVAATARPGSVALSRNGAAAVVVDAGVLVVRADGSRKTLPQLPKNSDGQPRIFSVALADDGTPIITSSSVAEGAGMVITDTVYAWRPSGWRSVGSGILTTAQSVASFAGYNRFGGNVVDLDSTDPHYLEDTAWRSDAADLGYGHATAIRGQCSVGYSAGERGYSTSTIPSVRSRALEWHGSQVENARPRSCIRFEHGVRGGRHR